MDGDLLGLLSLLVVAVSLAGWIHGMRTVRLAGRRPFLVAGFALGFALSIAAFVQEPGLLAGSAALLALLASGVFLGLAAISGQARTPPAVRVGETLPDFSARSDDDTLFESSRLRGRPVLIKFFRGHW